MKQGDFIVAVSLCFTLACTAVGAALWINDSINGVRTEIIKSESRTTKAIGELRGELGVLNTRVDSLEGKVDSLEEKVEGVIEHLRNRDAQTAPKDTSTLDLEETSP